MINIAQITYREQIQMSDIDAICRIIRSSGFFSPEEITIACELAEEKISDPDSSYQFLFVQNGNLVLGYTCFGLIPATVASYDLYWIAVDSGLRDGGLGKQLLTKTEGIIRSFGGKHVYAETSSRPQYTATHRFYERCGYVQEAFLKDFYSPGDGKIIYSKTL